MHPYEIEQKEHATVIHIRPSPIRHDSLDKFTADISHLLAALLPDATQVEIDTSRLPMYGYRGNPDFSEERIGILLGIARKYGFRVILTGSDWYKERFKSVHNPSPLEEIAGGYCLR